MAKRVVFEIEDSEWGDLVIEIPGHISDDHVDVLISQSRFNNEEDVTRSNRIYISRHNLNEVIRALEHAKKEYGIPNDNN